MRLTSRWISALAFGKGEDVGSIRHTGSSNFKMTDLKAISF